MSARNCEGSGHRFNWRKRLVACGRCCAWFHVDSLIYSGPGIPFVTGGFPDHKRDKR